MTYRNSAILSACILISGCGPTSVNPPGGPGLTILDEVPVGALVITEIQADPNSGRPEYVEFFVASDEEINLRGCQLVDGGEAEHRHSVTEDLVVAPGSWVLAGEPEFLGELAGDVPVTLRWTEIDLSSTDPLEELALNCPEGTGARHTVDRVAFDWSSLSVRQGHSWQLEAAVDATTNDSPESWCEAPSDSEAIFAVIDGQPDFGTPGAETFCHDLDGQPVTEPGQVVITELLVDEFTGLREWFELHNPGEVDLELAGCELGDASSDDPEASNLHTIEAEGGETVIEAGSYLLLAKSGLDVTSDASTLARYAYSSVSFNNSGEQLLWLDCPLEEGGPAVRIDEVTYRWDDFGSEFEGRSLSLDPSALDAEANDSASAWCLASEGDPFWTATEDEEVREAWGTPGAANQSCPVPDLSPLPGEVIFTEVLARSAGSEIGHNEEWFELLNLAEHSVSLDGCLIRNEDESGVSEHTIEPVFGLSVEAGAYVVLVRSSADDSMACGLPWEYAYGNNINFNNSDEELLSLLCGIPGEQQTVDAISFDGGAEGFEPGMPRQLRESAEDAELNNETGSWCVTADPKSYPWSCTVGSESNYGTPGSTSNCL